MSSAQNTMATIQEKRLDEYIRDVKASIATTMSPNRFDDRRDCERVPVSLEATITLPTLSKPMAVVVRDLSRSGLGLEHKDSLPLECGTIQMETEIGVFDAEIEIVWCGTPRDDVGFSGARILRVTNEPNSPESN